MYYVFICKLRLYVILKNILEYGNTWIKTLVTNRHQLS